MDKLYSSKGKTGRLLAATPREFHPGPCFYGCAAQYFFEGVQCGSIIVPPCRYCRRPLLNLLYGAVVSLGFSLWGKAEHRYLPTGPVQTECTCLPACAAHQRPLSLSELIGFVNGLQKHINSGYAFAERQIAHIPGSVERGHAPLAGLKDYPT